MAAQADPVAVSPRAPLVSIIVAGHNQGRFLRDALDSALAQEYSPVEVLYVDCGSKDDSLEVAASYAGRVRCAPRANLGPSGGRNVGIMLAEGDFFCFLDADDTMDSDCVLERIKPFLEDPEVGMVAGAFRAVDEQLEPLPGERQRTGTPNLRMPGLYIREPWSPTCGLLVSRRAVCACGLFDPFLWRAEDYDFQIRVTRKFRHVYDPVPRSSYRQIGSSISRNYSEVFDSVCDALRKNAAFADGRLQFRWHSFLALIAQSSGGVFGRQARERGIAEVLRTTARIALRRPIILVLFAAWAGRVVRNRLFRVARSSASAGGGCL